MLLGYTLSVGCSGAGLGLGEVADYATLSYPLRLRQPEKVGLWRGLCEVEVEGRAMASRSDR